MMLHTGSGHNCQIILEFLGFEIICCTKKTKRNLEVSEVLIAYVTYTGKSYQKASNNT